MADRAAVRWCGENFSPELSMQAPYAAMSQQDELDGGETGVIDV